MQIEKIICPVDFSECSHHALHHALAIARWYTAAVTVLHIAPAPPLTKAGPIAPTGALSGDSLLAEMAQFIGATPGLDVRAETREGNAVAGILGYATELAADLIVMGTHGRSGFERLVLGSVTEKLLRKASCPVLSVPPRVPDAPPSTAIAYRRILCPVDFSDPSQQALHYAISLAEKADAELTVLHVMEYELRQTPELYETIVSDDRLTLGEFRARYEAISRERVENAGSDEARTHCRIETTLGSGKPYREILRVAAERRSDVIVIGVRGRGAADLMFFGSTTQHVVRQATCPVLTLRGA